jgi:hypothetical protein
MERIKQVARSLLNRCPFRRPRAPTGIPQTQVQEQNRATGAWRRIPAQDQRTNPALQALSEIFAPRHAAEDQVQFKTIGPDGTTIEKSEEWFREGNALKTVSKRGFVVTCSGEIVAPENIKVKCSTCGGFDLHIARCSHPQCGVALCRLHQRVFAGASGSAIFCEKHYLAAIESFDTWAAFDRAKTNRHQKP